MRREDSRQNENAFKQAVRANEPGDVTEQAYKDAAEMFDAIKDEQAAKCAQQCRVLADQARQKAIYLQAERMETIARRPLS